MEKEYLYGYALVWHEWLALKEEFNAYQIPTFLKNDLIKLFELSENFLTEVRCTDHFYGSRFMREKWDEMRRLVKTISKNAVSASLVPSSN